MFDLDPGAYSLDALRHVHGILWLCILPAFHCLDHLAALYIPVTKELLSASSSRDSPFISFDPHAAAQHPFRHHLDELHLWPAPLIASSWGLRRCLRVALMSLVYLLGLTMFALPAVCAYPCWLYLTRVRTRSFCQTPAPSARRTGRSSSAASPMSLRHPSVAGPALKPPLSFRLATANVCLLPECAARANNLCDTQRRAAMIGSILSASQRPSLHRQPSETASSHSAGDASTSITEHILADFPADLDFVCLQEVFDRQATATLVKALKRSFPFVLFDAVHYTASLDSLLFGSGLLLASRYPIVSARFRRFSRAADLDRLACKGLLMAKVALAASADAPLVGYVFVTHLNAGAEAAHGAIRREQMDEIREWRSRFVSDTHRAGTERVVFDVLAGDLNFDNASDTDRGEALHPLLCAEYDDPCRENSVVFPVAKPGSLNNLITPASDRDKFWSVGTALRKQVLWHPQIASPAGLAEALKWCDGAETESGVYFIENAVRDGRSLRGRRRLDYVLFHKLVSTGRGPLPRDDGSDGSDGGGAKGGFATRVQSVSFVSRLARLSDHVPVVAQFQCVDTE